MTSRAAGSEIGYCSEPALHGDRLVFVSEGDLWSAAIPKPGGAAEAPIVAHRLTSSDGAESRPVFSPDGQALAFSGEYDGNTDVYVMPADGGAPTRLTFHPGADLTRSWTADGRHVVFSSPRAHPMGRSELWRVAAGGGQPQPFGFGECSMAAMSSTGKRLAFTPWSNEHWTWKRYRGGTAPEIWVGDLAAQTFQKITDDPGSDLFPMWVQSRVYFLSDRTGTGNIFSVQADGKDVKQHTRFAPRAGDPTAFEGYDVRWPAADAGLRGNRIAFCQAGGLVLLDCANDSLRRLDLRLASDRVAARRRFADPMKTATEYALSPDGTQLVVGSRGELLSFPVEGGGARQLTRSSGAREWGASYLDDEQLILISDLTGEQQIAAAPADGSAFPTMLTDGGAAWLFPPAGSPDGAWLAFSDHTQRLFVLSMATLERRQVDASDAWEITDYRFSPDGQWIAYAKPMPNGYEAVHLYAVRTARSFAVSDGRHDDREPRFDPAGKYLYFLSRQHLDPVMGELDFEHVLVGADMVFAVPLAAETPPPWPDVARSAGFDLEAWSKPPEALEEEDVDADAEVQAEDAEAERPPGVPPGDPVKAVRVDTDGLAARQYALPIPAGNFEQLEAVWGGVTWLERPLEGLVEEEAEEEETGLGAAKFSLRRFTAVDGECTTLAEKVSGYALSRDCSTIAHPAEEGFAVITVAEGAEGEPKTIDVEGTRLRVSIQEEWRQILQEAWRLQRDFYWAPNYKGADWEAMKAKYEALLPRVGTRAELNDLVGQMIGELGTSHTYVWGGEPADEVEPVPVGMLGADLEYDPRAGAFKIVRILPRLSWDEGAQSPLAEPHLGVREGQYLLAIDSMPLTAAMSVDDLLQDRAGKMVRLTVAADASGANRRTIDVVTLESEQRLRYAAWVEANRRRVDEATKGRAGYVHIPDMGAEGLIAFSRQFYPQVEKRALVVDVRGNRGGFVSQMIIERLNRKVWAFMRPRHGKIERFPQKSLYGHMVVLIDQHAGSDGDIFPESFRLLEMGPLIGTRTWGGVVGIRGDKPFMDLGLSTQPEFAWWEPKRGWSLENTGVSPDIEVPITPADRAAGRDPQLDKAIEVITAKLAEDPREPPEPPWPEK